MHNSPNLFDLKHTRKNPQAFSAVLNMYLGCFRNPMFSHLVVYTVCFFIPGQEDMCAQINYSIFMPTLINIFINNSLYEKHDKFRIIDCTVRVFNIKRLLKLFSNWHGYRASYNTTFQKTVLKPCIRKHKSLRHALINTRIILMVCRKCTIE